MYSKYCPFRKRSFDELTDEAKQFIKNVELKLGIPVTLIGTGPDAEDVIDRREELKEKK